MIIAVLQKGEPMEWIVEAETLSDFVNHGRYTIATKQLIRCRDCIFYCHKDYGLPYCGRLSGFYAVDLDDFCSWAKRRTDG